VGRTGAGGTMIRGPVWSGTIAPVRVRWVVAPQVTTKQEAALPSRLSSPGLEPTIRKWWLEKLYSDIRSSQQPLAADPGPSPLALFFGYRINVMATIRCYEWVSRGRYMPTCEITQRSRRRSSE